MNPRERVRLNLARPEMLPPSPAVLESEGTGELMQVGDLANATGKTVRAIHLYEELGLLKPGGARRAATGSTVPTRSSASAGSTSSRTSAFALRHQGDREGRRGQARDSAARRRWSACARSTRGSSPRPGRRSTRSGRSRARCSRASTTSTPATRSASALVLLPACPSCDHHPAEQAVPDLVAGRARTH